MAKVEPETVPPAVSKMSINVPVRIRTIVKSAARKRATTETAMIVRAVTLMDILDTELEAGNSFMLVAPDGTATKLVFLPA